MSEDGGDPPDYVAYPFVGFVISVVAIAVWFASKAAVHTVATRPDWLVTTGKLFIVLVAVYIVFFAIGYALCVGPSRVARWFE